MLLIPFTAISAYYYLVIIIIIMTNQDIETATPLQFSKLQLLCVVSLTVFQCIGIIWLPKLLNLITIF
jgi:NADH:ubiquinone oxidoreductase subunit 2 (subunit N)